MTKTSDWCIQGNPSRSLKLSSYHPVHRHCKSSPSNRGPPFTKSSIHSRPLASLAAVLFPFFRHVIANVRLSVVNTFPSFSSVPSLITISSDSSSDVREVSSFQAWKLAINSLAALNLLDAVPPNLLSRFSILMRSRRGYHLRSCNAVVRSWPFPTSGRRWVHNCSRDFRNCGNVWPLG